MSRRSQFLTHAARTALALLGLGAALSSTSCASIGPGSIKRDRFDYMESISDSWKRQTLINLVKLRYSDAPVFMSVDSVITAYTLESEVSLGATGSATRADSSVSVGATGTYSDQPTITYTPMTGAKFSQAIVSPFSISTLFALLQNGYRADSVLRVCVSSINGIDNAFGGAGSARPGSPYFAELVDIFRHLQLEGRLEIRRTTADEKTLLVMKLRAGQTPEMIGRDVRLHQLLGLDPSTNEFTIVPGIFPGNPREVAFATRSMLQIMLDLASYIEVPRSDVTEGRVYEPPRTVEQLRRYPPLLRIHSSEHEPQDAFASV